MSDIAEHVQAASDRLKAGDTGLAACRILAAATIAELGALHFMSKTPGPLEGRLLDGDCSMWMGAAKRLRDLAETFARMPAR